MLARGQSTILARVSSGDERIRRLQATAVFGGTRDDTVSFVLEKADSIEVAAGDWFFREGERGTSVYWLDAGTVAITRQRGNEEVELRRLGPGDVFGEVALLDFGPRSASVGALTDCRALELTSGLLHAIAARDLEQYTLLALNLGRELARRLRTVEAITWEREAGWDAAKPVPST
jgi:CRP/FNR family cyclic AMP-dependent transcriptional regulator